METANFRIWIWNLHKILVEKSATQFNLRVSTQKLRYAKMAQNFFHPLRSKKIKCLNFCNLGNKSTQNFTLSSKMRFVFAENDLVKSYCKLKIRST